MVKNGYKQTEIGVIPEDWEVDKLEKMIKIGAGKSPSIFKFHDKGIPYFKVEQLNNSDKYISSKHTSYFIENYSISENSIIFPKRGAAIFLNKIRILKQKSYFDTNLMSITILKKLNYEYLFYYLIYKGLHEIADTTSIPQINNKHIYPFKIPIPKKPEQEKIAKVLSDTDELIENLKELITKKEDIKKATMQQLLTGKKRLKGFSGEWVKRNIKKFGTVITGATPPTNIQYYWNGNIPWITPTDITEQKNISISERMITSEGLKQIRTIPKNSILVTCIASIGKNAILTKEGACNQQINVIIPNDKFNYEFIYYLIELNKNYLIAKAGVTATPIISKYDFEQFEFYIPQDITEQKAIAKILSDMDEEIEALKEKLEKIKSIKQGMMQELLSGRIRLI